MLTTIKYEITSAFIQQDYHTSRERWFLDAIQVDHAGRLSRTNVVNGDKPFCESYLAELLSDESS